MPQSKLYILVEGLVLFQPTTLTTNLAVHIHGSAHHHNLQVCISEKPFGGIWTEENCSEIKRHRSLPEPIRGAITFNSGGIAVAPRSQPPTGPKGEEFLDPKLIPNLESEFFCNSKIFPKETLSPIIDVPVNQWWAVRREGGPRNLASVDARALEGIWDIVHGRSDPIRFVDYAFALKPRFFEGAVTIGTVVDLEEGTVVSGKLGDDDLFPPITVEKKDYTITIQNFPPKHEHSDGVFEHRFHTKMLFDVIHSCGTPRILIRGIPNLLDVIQAISENLMKGDSSSAIKILEDLAVLSPGQDPVCPAFLFSHLF